MIPHNEWAWYGFAGHLCVGRHCAYHLCTRIGSRLVSTVGAFFPDRNSTMETIGAGEIDFFETMIFPCDGEDEYGNPNLTSRNEIGCIHYATSIEAEQGHRKLCEATALEQ